MTETPYSLDKVAIRMVKKPPLYSSTPVRSPDDAVRLIAEMLKGYDREDGEWSGWRGTNGSKSNKIYFDHHNGACFNGTYFDIREYVWQEDCEYYAIRNNGSVAARGTWENNNDGVNSEYEMLWVEVEGSPSKPLTLAYWVNKTRASGINYFGTTIKYELVPAEVTYLDDSASDGGQYKDGAISWKLTLAAHEPKTVTFNVKVNDPEAAYTHVFNQAEVAVEGTKKDTDSPVHTIHFRHRWFRLYADLRQHPGTHGLAEGSERQI